MPGRALQPADKTAPRRIRAALWGLLALALAAVLVTNHVLTSRFADSTRRAAEQVLGRYSAALMTELRQQRVVAQLLAADAELRAALEPGARGAAAPRLRQFAERIGAASLALLDGAGDVVARVGGTGSGAGGVPQALLPQMLEAPETVFPVALRPGTDGSTEFAFYIARRMGGAQGPRGAVVLELDLTRFERDWAGTRHAVMLTDAQGRVLLATDAGWRGQMAAQVLRGAPPGSVPTRARQIARQALAGWWTTPPGDAVLDGAAVMRHAADLPHAGWRLLSFTPHAEVRQQTLAPLALVAMGFALLAAALFYLVSRRTGLRLALFAREQAELRRVNLQLQQEVAERKRVQENLAVAEQTLEQSSKLAALGEMSAAVSHELNQPLAAMKTYLAGARLLLRRNRPDEALAAFGRIDRLIERMGAITRQLKSYARKGQDEWSPVNLQDSLAAALSMMAPQLRERQVAILRNLPERPVEVLGDRLRIEQVIINLLRNALDATKATRDARVEIILAAGETATLTIRDNGPGIADQNALFEPFYTTKQPGDGVGLGLAISSGIVGDLGGRLTARNGQSGGAVFEMQLPILNGPVPATDTSAAE